MPKGEKKVVIGIWWRDFLIIILAYWGVKAGFLKHKLLARVAVHVNIHKLN